jgi:hypothetical protein
MEDHQNDPAEPRPPERSDLVAICRKLNELGALYIIVGGLAILETGYARSTEDLDFLVETSEANGTRVLEALMILEDRVAAEISPQEIPEFTVVRICDEITVDLMAKACGITYEEAKDEIIWREIDGVKIPFASPRLLWWTKDTVREKDHLDRLHLAKVLRAEGSPVPPPPL